MKTFLKYAAPDVLCVLLFLALSVAYFITPVSQGLVLGGHDNTGGIGMGHETQVYQAETGEHTRWTNSVFSGMPTYQISPSYPSTDTLLYIQRAYQLGITGPVSYLFIYLVGFYILLRVLRIRPVLAAAGAVMWAFSSYFLIIITAGHIWKVMTLGFIPPTIAGLILCYRGRLLWGAAVTALFTALQIYCNHVQMSYYFAFLMLFIVVAYGIAAFLPKKDGAPLADESLTPARWLRATLVVAVAGLIGVAANVSNLYHTYEYQQHSMRGKAELTPLPAADGQPQAKAEEGLERDYITAWSYGIGETMTLMIPDFKGGGSGSIVDKDGAESLPGYDDFYQGAYALQVAAQQSGQQIVPPGANTYWGDQPGTVGPVYVGALVCFFFVLGLFLVRGPLKWALVAATVVSLLFAWGKNLMPATDFFIDHLPLYNKFRTVSSALVVAEFTMPLLAVLCLARVIRRPDLLRSRHGHIALGVSFALTGGVCLLLGLIPGLAGSPLSAGEQSTLAQLNALMPADILAAYRSGITSMRHAVLSADALRSFSIILLGTAALLAYTIKKLPAWGLAAIVGAVCLVDMWQIDKRYLNDDCFTDPVEQSEQLAAKTAADDLILQDKGEYRVLNITRDIFNDNSTSYYHKNIGGYHPAKLHRYQDLIERQLQHEIPQLVGAINDTQGDMAQVAGDSLAPVLNMLNLKYIIFGDEANKVIQNPYANGNGWFVSQVKFVKNADEEMAALTGLDTKHVAVADAQFKDVLDGSPLDSGTVSETRYAPNELRYTVESPKGGLVVFSEVYYPGWTATIDGTEAPLGRADYILRALRVPAGRHEVVLEFRPKSIARTEAVAYTGLALTLLTFVLALVGQFRRARGDKQVSL
ncbi:MAG: YfhO family protein [Bacteroidaceae bacterium]|nr:YfhO family protein [Bacteroidaceae bacterium]